MNFDKWKEDPLWEKLLITTEKVQNINDPEFIWKNVVVWGHWQHWVAESGAGKTTIAWTAAKEIAERGEMDVIYAHFDTSGADLKGYVAEANSYENLSLVGSVDVSSDDFVTFLKRMRDRVVTGDLSLNRTMIFLDTLNQFVDTMQKKQMVEFGKLIKGLTGKGCTVICLHHTTKRRDERGNLIFDGVGEVKKDCDELWYIDHVKDEIKNTHTVTMTSDKNRGLDKFFKPHTFRWDRDERIVTSVDFVDLAAAEAWAKIVKENPHIVEPMVEKLAFAPMNQTDATEYLSSNHGIGVNKARSLLQHGVDREWKSRRGGNNSVIYYVATPSNL